MPITEGLSPEGSGSKSSHVPKEQGMYGINETSDAFNQRRPLSPISGTKDDKSLPQQGKPFHVDLTTGLVHTRPLRDLQIPISVGVTSEQEAARLAESQFRQVRINLAETGRLGRFLKSVHHVARIKLQRAYLPEPGLVQLDDTYYTGWYLVDDGITMSVYRKSRATEGQKYNEYQGISSRRTDISKGGPNFQLTPAEADYWQKQITSGPLTLSQANLLEQTPNATSHPLYSQLMALALPVQIQVITAEAEGYYERGKVLEQAGDRAAEAEYVKSNLLKLAIFDIVSKQFYKEALSAVIEKMEESATTVFPLGRDAAVVGYRVARHMAYRVVAMPQDKTHLFQRYGVLKQPPMSKEEFVRNYHKLVDPNKSFE